ncbi:MAG: U32 family peptidase, partial [Syntrophomonas sp.]
GADAVYLGGKRFNMRMLKSDYNFSNEELIRAVDYLHEKDKKLYVTVNNLYYEDEIEELKDYLLFLEEINVDALIEQDMGVVDLHNEMGLNIALHCSVQMGIGNSQAVKLLEKNGLSRVILSKNVSLQEINEIHKATGMVIEFFAHGDLCVSHTGQCYMSNLFFGDSSNRGRCKKPCRWKYRLERSGFYDEELKYLLANKDLCLFAYLADLAKAGVSSFKIEGRMRTEEYVAYLIRTYREAMDRVIDNLDTFQVDESGMTSLNVRRVRDYTTGNLLERPGLDSIGLTGEREPFFPTTTVKLEPLQKDSYSDEGPRNHNAAPELTVKVGNIQSFRSVMNQGIDNIIISLDIIRQDKECWTVPKINEALNMVRKSGTKVFLETPRIITEDNLGQFEKHLGNIINDRLDGIIVNDYGSLNLIINSTIAGKPIWAGTGLNLSNSRAANALEGDGFTRLTVPLELDINNLVRVTRTGIPVEVMVHGPLCGLITDLCIPRSLNNEVNECAGYCLKDDYALVDEYGQKYKILSDYNCRNYLFYPYDLCLFFYLPLLKDLGVKSVKIEGQYYTEDTLLEVVKIYQEALQDLKNSQWTQKDNYNRLLEIFSQGLTATPLVNNLLPRGSLHDYRNGDTQPAI